METEYFDADKVKSLIKEIDTNSEKLICQLEEAIDKPVPVKFHLSVRLNKSSINGLIGHLMANLKDLEKLKPRKV